MADGRFLTISLLSSGRRGTIERCLVSLAPFKEQLDTEIIVVDTDPNHDGEVRRILEKYADRIIPFEWQDDFSAARNAGIDAAHGKWFLYVDDDEWFIDAQPLIDFLKSDGEKKYRLAHYPVRNYFDEAHTRYQDTWVSRLFWLAGKPRFFGKIHEIVRPVEGNAKLVSALAGHTGYIYRNEEDRIVHVRRNLGPLLRQMEEEPREIRWVVQAMLEYHTLKDADQALACARRAYELLEGEQGYDNACLRGYVGALRIRAECVGEAGRQQSHPLPPRAGRRPTGAAASVGLPEQPCSRRRLCLEVRRGNLEGQLDRKSVV